MGSVRFAAPAVAESELSAAHQNDIVATQATAQIVAAYLAYLSRGSDSFTTDEATDQGTFSIQPSELPDLIRSVRGALREVA